MAQSSVSTATSATSTLIKVIKDPDRPPIQFTGLTPGPPDVEGGKYIQTMFATDVNGNIYALDRSGNLLPDFLNGATSVSHGDRRICRARLLAETDYNLWHATATGSGAPGHGIPASPDLVGSRGVNSGGGTSYYFGLEDRPRSRETISSSRAPVATRSPRSIAAADRHPDPNSPEGHEELLNTYNMPGGAYGSLTSSPFSLAGYTASDKPTLYFDYSLDTQEAK